MEEDDSENDSAQSNTEQTGLPVSQTDSHDSSKNNSEEHEAQSALTGSPTLQTESQSVNTENESSQSKGKDFKVPEVGAAS